MTRPTFAPWWQPWRWCWARVEVILNDDGSHHYDFERGEWTFRPGLLGRSEMVRCRLPRRHFGRHACFDGFDVRYFDSAKEGTP